MIDDITRSLPYALGPEKSVLSSILKDPREFIDKAAELGLTPGQFYMPAHSTLLTEILRMDSANEEIEFIGLTQHLLDVGMLDMVGGPGAMADLYNYAATGGYFAAHVREIRDKHILRSLIRISNETIAECYDSPGEAQETLDQAERAILAVRDDHWTDTAETVSDALSDVLGDLQSLCEGKRDELGLSTGFTGVDKLTNGLKPGEVFVIAARPSMGKTALMMNIAEHVVFDLEKPTLIFSCEMARKQLVSRILYSRAKVNLAALQYERPDRGVLQRVQREATAIHTNNGLHIDDTPGIKITALQAKARRMKKSHGIQFIAIDYLQLVKSGSRQAQNSREREIAEISAGIKGLAKELSLPILILAQLNRDSEKRTGKAKGVPRMADLRESGAIEQDADIIGLLYRDAYFAEDDEEKKKLGGQAKLILAKNRSGATGDVHLTFIPDLVRFENGFAPKTAPNNEPQTRW